MSPRPPLPCPPSCRPPVGPAGAGPRAAPPAGLPDWSAPPPHYSGLDNPGSRKSFEDFQRQSGGGAARWCGGCPPPALLASGMLERPLAEIAAAPAATVGVSCTVCHAISRVKSSQGQADFELDPPAWDGLAGSSSQPARVLHDLAVRRDPEPHRRAYSPPPLPALAAH